METMKVGTSNPEKRLVVTRNRKTRVVAVPVPGFGMVGLGKVDDSMIVLDREQKGVSLDKSCVAEIFNNFSSGCWEELNEEFNELCETKFCVNGPAMIDLDSDEDLVMEYLLQEESRLKQEEEEMCHLEEHKMMEALFLKTLQEEDLSRYNQSTDRVHLTDAFDIFLGRQGPLRCRFPWCKDHVGLWVNYMWHVRPHDADWAMVGGYFVQLLLQDSIPSWYADNTLYKVSRCDVEEFNWKNEQTTCVGIKRLLDDLGVTAAKVCVTAAK
ncbi:hypothetical protein Tco_1293621 [Tanacetum coccineum]